METSKSISRTINSPFSTLTWLREPCQIGWLRDSVADTWLSLVNFFHNISLGHILYLSHKYHSQQFLLWQICIRICNAWVYEHNYYYSVGVICVMKYHSRFWDKKGIHMTTISFHLTFGAMKLLFDLPLDHIPFTYQGHLSHEAPFMPWSSR